jgi:hypothetical protein
MPDPFVVARVGLSRVRWLGRDCSEGLAGGEFAGGPVEAGHTRAVMEVHAGDLVEEAPGDRFRPRVASFAVCGLPDGHPQWESYAVWVVNVGGGWWQIRRYGRRVVSVDGRETLAVRDDCPEDTPDLFMDVDSALRVAARHARELRLRQGTADEVLAATTT